MSKPKGYEQFARYLSAALIAHRLGISIGYAYEQYAKDKPVGDQWLVLAAAMDKAAAEIIDGSLGLGDALRLGQKRARSIQ